MTDKQIAAVDEGRPYLDEDEAPFTYVPTPDGWGYIADQHPDDLPAQRALARRLLAYGQTALDQAAHQATELEAEAHLLYTQAKELRAKAAETNNRQQMHIRTWFEQPGVREYFGRKLLLGRYTVAWGKRARSYTVDERAILRRAEVDPTLAQQGIVEYTVDKKAARDRFKLDDEGQVIDTATGEVVEEDVDGFMLLVVTDPGGPQVKITATKDE